MATTLTNIQSDVRFYANDSVIDLTTAADLRRVNAIYHGMFSPGWEVFPGLRIGMRWAEQTREDTSLSTTAGTAAYTWPTSPVFLKETVTVEILRQSGGTDYQQIRRAADEREWLAHKNSGNAFPVFYRWMDSAGTTQLQFAPAPDTSSLTIRLRGLVQPDEFTSGSSQTAFDEIRSDKAFAMLIAAEYKHKRGDINGAMELAGRARGFLPHGEIGPTGQGDMTRIQAHYL